jgi:hypothetical protein
MSLLFRRGPETVASNEIPPIDRAVPEHLQSATFAVG